VSNLGSLLRRTVRPAGTVPPVPRVPAPLVRYEHGARHSRRVSGCLLRYMALAEVLSFAGPECHGGHQSRLGHAFSIKVARLVNRSEVCAHVEERASELSTGL
jgi:hypothetical protein